MYVVFVFSKAQMKRRQQQNLDAAKAKHRQLQNRQQEHDRERLVRAAWLETDHTYDHTQSQSYIYIHTLT